jgi:hypothetical protein
MRRAFFTLLFDYLKIEHRNLSLLNIASLLIRHILMKISY